MIEILSAMLFIFALGFYLITAMQWFSYKFERVIFHFTKPLWHTYFIVLPLILYAVLNIFNPLLFKVYLAIYIASLAFWHARLDKKLVMTARVKRFFMFLALSAIFTSFLFTNWAQILPVILPLFMAFLLSNSFESFQSKLFLKSAKKKLESMPNLTIIMITASYGKTSIKNFLYQILSSKFSCYKTPRSVNTLMGLVRDINDDLPDDTEIYIAEAGARLKGDIAEITAFLSPKIVVVGEVGEQHIEYFITLDNIRSTKLEALNSTRLERAFVHSSTLRSSDEKTSVYDESLGEVVASLEDTEFSLEFGGNKESFKAPVLGKFNASNIAACVKIAEYLGLNLDNVKKSVANLKSVEHRLERMDAGGKIIIDDSFNGNLKGMSESYELVATYTGRKVIVTPGIVEATPEMNEALGRKIDEIFDLVMITGELNAEILKGVIDKNKLIEIKDKSNLTKILGKKTKAGDLILFSNDAPSFI